MNMIPVRSSAIAAIGYEASTQRMVIRFTSGDSYTFCRVPEHIFSAFMASSSKGGYYDRQIRGRYQC